MHWRAQVERPLLFDMQVIARLQDRGAERLDHLPHCVNRRRYGNLEPPAHRVSELGTRSASALLQQYETRFGQHPLLPGG